MTPILFLMLAQGAGLRKIQCLFGHLLVQLQGARGAKHPSGFDTLSSRGVLIKNATILDRMAKV